MKKHAEDLIAVYGPDTPQRCGPISSEPVADMEELVTVLNQMLACMTVFTT